MPQDAPARRPQDAPNRATEFSFRPTGRVNRPPTPIIGRKIANMAKSWARKQGQKQPKRVRKWTTKLIPYLITFLINLVSQNGPNTEQQRQKRQRKQHLTTRTAQTMPKSARMDPQMAPKLMASHGQSWPAIASHGWPWPAMAGHGRPWGARAGPGPSPSLTDTSPMGETRNRT